jgi:hypothetical protein
MPVEPTYDVGMHLLTAKIIQRLVASALVENMRQIFHNVLPNVLVLICWKPPPRRTNIEDWPIVAASLDFL